MSVIERFKKHAKSNLILRRVGVAGLEREHLHLVLEGEVLGHGRGAGGRLLLLGQPARARVPATAASSASQYNWELAQPKPLMRCQNTILLLIFYRHKQASTPLNCQFYALLSSSFQLIIYIPLVGHRRHHHITERRPMLDVGLPEVRQTDRVLRHSHPSC